MFCPKCGNEIIDINAKFCDKCGQLLGSGEIAEQINTIDFSSLGFSSMLSLSWDIFKKEAIFLSLLIIGMIVTYFIPVINMIFFGLWGIIISPFFYIVIKKYQNRERLVFNDIFFGLKKFWKLLFVTILNSIITFIGFFCMIFIYIFLLYKAGIDITNVYKFSYSYFFSNIVFIPFTIIFFIIIMTFLIFSAMLLIFTSLRIMDSYSGVIENISYSIKNIWKNFSTIISYSIGISILMMLGSILTLGFALFVFIPVNMIFHSLLYFKFRED